MAMVPDSAAVLGTWMCTAVVDKGLKGLKSFHVSDIKLILQLPR